MIGSMLHLSGLEKFYGSIDHGVQAVKNFSMNVEKGEITALLGSSGCGKTSTLRMIAGFESVSRGQIFIDQPVERCVLLARCVVAESLVQVPAHDQGARRHGIERVECA